MVSVTIFRNSSPQTLVRGLLFGQTIAIAILDGITPKRLVAEHLAMTEPVIFYALLWIYLWRLAIVQRRSSDILGTQSRVTALLLKDGSMALSAND